MSDVDETPTASDVAGPPAVLDLAAASVPLTASGEAGGIDGLALTKAAQPDDGADPVDALRDEVGRAVLGHSGVLRLEPTLLGAVRGLAQRDSLDGIRLDTHGRVVDLDVNVATRADHQARESMIELHHQLVDLVTEHGFVPGAIQISVLAIERPAL